MKGFAIRESCVTDISLLYLTVSATSKLTELKIVRALTCRRHVPPLGSNLGNRINQTKILKSYNFYIF